MKKLIFNFTEYKVIEKLKRILKRKPDGPNI